MNRISLFRTRIVIEDKVYLLAKDVRKALGCKSIEQLQVEYPEIVQDSRASLDCLNTYCNNEALAVM